MRYKRKWKKITNEFNYDIKKVINNIFSIAIITTYTSYQHRKHIREIWWMLRNYKDFKKEYDKNLFGKHLTGEETMMKTLYFCYPDLYKKYKGKIPEKYALGTSLRIAYSFLKKFEG